MHICQLIRGSFIWYGVEIFSRIAWDKVYVGVGDFKPFDFESDAFALQLITHVSHEFLRGGHDRQIVFNLEILKMIDLFARYDQDRAGLHRIDVEEGKCPLVLIDFVAGNLPIDDFGKDGILHIFSINSLRTDGKYC